MTVAQKVIKYLAIAFAMFLIVSIISAILSVLFGLRGILGLKKEDSSYSKEMSITNFENTNILVLDIDIAYTNLTIKTGENLKVETNNSNINFKQDNTNLQIKEKSYNWFSKSNNGELILYIPENIEFDKVKINTGAGKIIIDNITTKNLSFELGAGEAKVKSLNVLNDADIEGGAGKMDVLSGTINNLDFDMGVGEVNLAIKLTGKSKIDAGVGNLNIDINGRKDDYEIKTSKGLGSIKIDGKEISNDTIYGNGVNYIEVDGGVGNITIDFN